MVPCQKWSEFFYRLFNYNLLLGICVIRDVGKVCQLWGVDLLHLGHYVHGSGSHQLQPATQHRGTGEKPVHDVDGHEHGVKMQGELIGDLH